MTSIPGAQTRLRRPGMQGKAAVLWRTQPTRQTAPIDDFWDTVNGAVLEGSQRSASCQQYAYDLLPPTTDKEGHTPFCSASYSSLRLVA